MLTFINNFHRNILGALLPSTLTTCFHISHDFFPSLFLHYHCPSFLLILFCFHVDLHTASLLSQVFKNTFSVSLFILVLISKPQSLFRLLILRLLSFFQSLPTFGIFSKVFRLKYSNYINTTLTFSPLFS